MVPLAGVSGHFKAAADFSRQGKEGVWLISFCGIGEGELSFASIGRGVLQASCKVLHFQVFDDQRHQLIRFEVIDFQKRHGNPPLAGFL